MFPAGRVKLIILFLVLIVYLLLLEEAVPSVRRHKKVHPVANHTKYYDELRLDPLKHYNKTLINPHDFPYMQNPGFNICGKEGGENVTLLAVIPISANAYSHRFIIRSTWGSKNLYKNKFKYVFLVGRGKGDDMNKKIKHESDEFGDIVQEDFQDTYYNLTIKTVMGFKWAATYCHQAKFLLKIDDDIVVNIGNLIHYLENKLKNNPGYSNTILGHAYYHNKVMRALDNKWRIPYEVYNETYYPVYVNGACYIVARDLVKKLYIASLDTKQFLLEDVYVGFLGQKLNITFGSITQRISHWSFYNNFNDIMRMENISKAIDYFYFIRIKDRLSAFSVWRYVSENLIQSIFDGIRSTD